MKKQTLLFIILLYGSKALSQQQEHTVDSVMAARTLYDINQLFNLSPGQKDTIYQAGVWASIARRQVYARYWQTDSFRVKMSQVTWLKDSLYRAVLGPANFKLYRDTLIRRGKTW